MIKRILIVGVIAGTFVLVSTMDADDAARAYKSKCRLIEEGVWPAEVEPSCTE